MPMIDKEQDKDLAEKDKKTETMSQNQRLVLGFLVIMGATAIILGFLQFSQNVNKPFKPKISNSIKENTAIAQGQESEIDVLALRGKDTDKDGLSDYDELYVFNTSPYLEDSDSDGFSDSQEIDSGNEPNCPSGKTCGTIPQAVSAAPPAPLENLSLSASESGSDINENITEQLRILQGGMTIEELRQLMLESGVPKEALDQLDDASLKELYRETLEEMGSE